MCPICKDEAFTKIGRPRINSIAEEMLLEEYFVVKCVTCGFYYVSPGINFSRADWQILYDSEYFQPMTNWHSRMREKNRKERFKKLNRFSTKPIKKFLDVGCGEGYSLLEAESRGWQSYGVDISDNRLEQAKNKNIFFVNGDLISANFPDEYFNCIYVDSVLEHVLNPLEYLKELNRILSKGGIIYVGVPNEDSLQNDLIKIMYMLTGREGESSKIKPFSHPFHVGGFNYNSLNLAISQSGFSIKQLRNFASKSEIFNWKILSREFFITAFLTPFNFIAFIIRREVYYEAYLTK